MDTSIKLIDVYGQFEDQGTNHYYTYLPTGQEAPAGWRNVMKDPRNEVASNMQQCYVTWCTATDWWIAKMVRNPHDSRGGFAMLSICLGPKRPLDGEKAVAVLDYFTQFFIIDKHWDDGEAEKALINEEQDLVLVPCAPRKFVEPTAAINSAFRSFETKEELGWYLSFLPQPGYEAYSRIFFVPKEESQGMPSVKCLDGTLPLKKIYTLKYPDDKCVSTPLRSEIMDGEDLIIVYNKAGFEPVERVITGGKNTECAFVSGLEMVIRPEKEVKGLVHNRVITIKCQDKEEKVIDRFRLKNCTSQFNDVKINDDHHQVILPENFSERVVLDVIPSDDRYETKQVPLDLGSIKADANIIIVELELKDYKVVFKMGGDEYETLKTMNPSYARNRLSGFDYSVNSDKKTITFTVYGKPHERHHEEVHTTVENLPFFERFPWLMYVIIGLAVLLLGYGIYAGVSGLAFHKTPWPFGGKTEVKGEVVNNTEGQEPVQLKQEVFNPVADSLFVMKKHDIDYLMREKKIWVRDSIQSKEFQTMYDVIAGGDVEKVISQYDTLFGESNKTNNTLKMIVEGLKKVDQISELRKPASDEMKRLSRGGSIKMDELLTSINMIVAKSQPSKPKAQTTESSVKSSNNSSVQNANTPTERPNSSD